MRQPQKAKNIMVQVGNLPQSSRGGWSCKARNLLPGAVQTAQWRELFQQKSSRAPGVPPLRLHATGASRSFGARPLAYGAGAGEISPVATSASTLEHDKGEAPLTRK